MIPPMKERPILFSGPMVRAILDGTKTQTRRVVRCPKGAESDFDAAMSQAHARGWRGVVQYGPCDGVRWRIRCPYGAPGDRLWVRETHAYLDRWVDNVERGDPVVVGYRADDSVYRLEPEPERVPLNHPSHFAGFRWRPSIHMPRWASRITLKVTDVRVERLQDITESDAKAEGCTGHPVDGHSGYPIGYAPEDEFRDLWDSINAKRGHSHSWASNPWVWVVSFRRLP